jgi:hypothetical protein
MFNDDDSFPLFVTHIIIEIGWNTNFMKATRLKKLQIDLIKEVKDKFISMVLWNRKTIKTIEVDNYKGEIKIGKRMRSINPINDVLIYLSNLVYKEAKENLKRIINFLNKENIWEIKKISVGSDIDIESL